ncbi:MAG: histone deacetylase, partial [Cyanobacteria bacterium J083]
MPIIYSPQFLQHETGLFHPEKPARLTAIVKALQQVPWRDRFDWQLPTPVTARNLIPLLEKIHSLAYLQELQTIASQGGGYLDADTPVSARSYDVALLAVSAWLDGVDSVIANQIPVFALTRPPGHHATKTRGMGFCLLSNAAIAATYALQQANINKVAILDWDVHHGNGTQEIVENNRQIAYCSLHQFPFYPGTGSSEEKGIFNNVLNLPLPAGSTYADYESKFINDVIPFITDFQ